MNAALKIYVPPILTDTHNVIFSLALPVGLSPLLSQIGRKIGQSGQAHARVNLSARQAKALGLMTSGTYGRPSIGSSNSADLQSSLANRLQAQLSGLGSTLYSLTWKPWATPAGRMLVQQRGSARQRTYWAAITNTERNQQSREESRSGANGRMGRVIEPVSWDGPWQSALSQFRTMGDGLPRCVAATDAARNAIVPQQAAQFVKSLMMVA